jgi:nitroreductase
MLKTIIERTSCRSYLKQSIPHEKIAQLKQAINASPTARNLQDFSCIFITDETIRQKLSVFANQQLHVKEAPLFLIFIADQNRPNSLTK